MCHHPCCCPLHSCWTMFYQLSNHVFEAVRVRVQSGSPHTDAGARGYSVKRQEPIYGCCGCVLVRHRHVRDDFGPAAVPGPLSGPDYVHGRDGPSEAGPEEYVRLQSLLIGFGAQGLSAGPLIVGSAVATTGIGGLNKLHMGPRAARHQCLASRFKMAKGR